MKRKLKRKLEQAYELLVTGYKKFSAVKTSKLLAYLIFYSWVLVGLFDINVTMEFIVYSIILMLFAIYLTVSERPNIHVHVHDSKKPKQ